MMTRGGDVDYNGVDDGSVCVVIMMERVRGRVTANLYDDRQR